MQLFRFSEEQLFHFSEEPKSDGWTDLAHSAKGGRGPCHELAVVIEGLAQLVNGES